MTPIQPALGAEEEGFVDIDGVGYYVIPDLDRMDPFLMSIVSNSDHWMFVSSRGGLTAGRRDSSLALFPYETDDRLHHASCSTGPVTLIRPTGTSQWWEPFRDAARPEVQRNLYKSVVGDQVIFEEIHHGLGLAFRYRWSTSDRFGFVRTVTLGNVGDRSVTVDLVDGLLNVMPFGIEPTLHQRLSNLANAYKRSEIVDEAARLAVYSLESHVVDRPEPAEVLRASVVWSHGLPAADVGLRADALERMRRSEPFPTAPLATGTPGAYLVSSTKEIASGATAQWFVVGDVNASQSDVIELLAYLRSSPDVDGDLTASIEDGSEALVARMASADALQRAGDRMATAHHFANVLYNTMRGGVFISGTIVRGRHFAAFVEGRNRVVAAHHQALLLDLPDEIGRHELYARVTAAGDPQLMRLFLDYLPLTFSRRHGDPSRPWNEFTIQVEDSNGEPLVHYEGNWRDIFQNWEALCVSFPEYLPSVVSVFLNSSTAEGFNPYRITSDGFEWEVEEPENPWSNIGYWGDHQIVYLLRLLELAGKFEPGALHDMLGRPWFSYAETPYRLASYSDLVRNPKETIEYDYAGAEEVAARVDVVGGDGRLVAGRDGDVYTATMLEKLLVPALSKLANFVPGGGIWMNTQRPEWNDANNALVGYGLSMVTLYYLRRYLHHLADLASSSDLPSVDITSEVVDWLERTTKILDRHRDHLGGDLTGVVRRAVMDELGEACFEYRSRIYEAGFAGSLPVAPARIEALCESAIAHLDDTIRRNRRPDGMYHSYNLVHLAADGPAAHVEHLYEMLEGQVAVLSSGVLTAEQQLEVLEGLFDSAMYRPDQHSFLLYPAQRLPSFLEKNVLQPADVADNPLLEGLLAAGDESIVVIDAGEQHRFNAELSNRADLERVLDLLAGEHQWRELVAAHRESTLETYERVFRHHAFTGRSGSMYGYEGIGSVYWHMVAKLLLAVQEALVDASDAGVADDVVAGLVDMYWRIRSGLGFEKTAIEFGAFPVDAYSHTPAHAGAQQPGMTGQVKEELLTRPLELGVRVKDGEIRFDPVLLRADELLRSSETWRVVTVDGRTEDIELPAGALGMTLCQVPIVVAVVDGAPSVEVFGSDGTRRPFDGLRIDRSTSAAIFDRTGDVSRVEVRMSASAVTSNRD